MIAQGGGESIPRLGVEIAVGKVGLLVRRETIAPRRAGAELEP
jgi:hypothetical protein